ncbi:astacin-like metalloprotease [Dinothrombium tinctorium]|uniref:Metalloendopeptidase n=1 Tax=Dinothrombium tinctorium TaxID=1965070 RepID=A0A3S3QZJ2_9ACAR|nr:astacin-like metalloprotease [Dinothrombium tinctorium]RWS16352.1 astacin-like metalloprotease [Dinothrombium tinctorium]RWS16841.1 astacin-like metalloprotease [Dinothrombium tinctorium]RWS16873.1 astacin-like metalloprotease [Dinothrombium tinctorium]
MLFSNTFNVESADKVQLWPNGVIPYVIHQDLWQEEDLILASMRHIEDQTCIKFKPRENEKDYIGIIKGSGCYSYVGKLNRGGPQPVSIGEGCEFAGSIIHELIHVTGFHHEHSRIDRDKYVKILWNNLSPDTTKQFAKVDPKKYPQFYKFDYESVMLYGSTAFSKDGRSPTMIPIRGGRKRLQEVYHKKGMSPTDAKRIRKLYRCNDSYMKKK